MPFTFLPNGCSWYETHRLGGCIRRATPRRECEPPTTVAAAAALHHHRLAVIVPFRAGVGRQGLGALHELCRRLPEHLNTHDRDLHHRIFVVNQTDGRPFNRGALVNAAVRVLSGGRSRWAESDYLAIHDADRFPVEGNRTGCAAVTPAYYSYPAREPRGLHPDSFAGGVLVLRTHLFRAVNGFSNQYWGWGEEDNDLFVRLRWCGLPPRHGPMIETCMEHHDCAACKRQKAQLDHEALRGHEARFHARLPHPRPHMLRDGLTTLNFTLHAVTTQRCGGGGRTSVSVLQVALEGGR
eukprot:4195411-Prymnesium_polylepis.1